ncbi:hypothetical protein Celaphus_00013220 [Cervus elaphus hippelaphus]|uniref:Uncharacterized protein n=1 Tax=Cervus elaphus hippelaphus TaxID=46360 RepID=A0A212DGF0_CEREH|nr:hypothetical protein Celaphus_00013220 [Cervus elaphus hippelaphus]
MDPFTMDRAIGPCRGAELEDMLALSIIKGHAALGPGQADRHFSVVRHSCTGCLRILVKAKAPAPQDTVHVLPRPGGGVTW